MLHAGPIVVLSAKQIEDLRELPDSVVDNEEPIMRVCLVLLSGLEWSSNVC